ncbi:hypothetical protein [Bradyrhizobium sp. SUTN9-2]|uniref:hypothetical protein n=1 Tax=Bradyrhizobium sp. SUTN9-2 TaxID=1167456 RepID=UPI00186421BD|nr:hypothetical protein [Bradyrhizobium sp. SUTN9-2]
MTLAHTVSDKVESAYRRGDMREKRRRMKPTGRRSVAGYRWSRDGNVVPMKA